MADLKLPRLPDRTPIKMSISIPPELYVALNAYADAYEAAYGLKEAVSDLIPYMLDSFISGDRSFTRGRKE